MAVTPDGKRAISASGDHTLKVWDLERGRELATFTAESLFNCCAFTGNGNTVIAGDDLGRVHLLVVEEPRPPS